MRKAILKLAASFILASFALFSGMRQSQNNEAANENEQFNEMREDLVGRREWLFNQRAFPFNSIPNDAYARAFEHRRRYLQPQRQQAISNTNDPVWISLGPESLTYRQQPFSRSGRLTALAIDRKDSKIMYAGGSLGGVWKTIDGGNLWNPLTDFQPTLAVGSIAIDPTNSNILYVGTGDKNFHGFNYFGAGILKSTDGGKSFAVTASETFRGVSIGEIAINSTNPRILYAAVSRGFAGAHARVDPPTRSTVGVYRSVDNGVTWNRLTAAPAGDVMDIQIDPTNPRANAL